MNFSLPFYPDYWTWFATLFLYAEIHYLFPGVYSRLFKKEPEIVADVPHRIDPAHPLPVLLIIKDAHRFPLVSDRITVDLYRRGQKHRLLEHDFQEMVIDKPMWSRLFHIPLPDSISGKVKVDVQFSCKIDNKMHHFHNDNYRGTGHEPFDVLIDAEPLPKVKNWHFGDMHYHSDFTSDQVEFGAPLEATVAMAKAMGLDFMAVTDHSYDLDDYFHDYLKNDPDLGKWYALLQKVQDINAKEKVFTILPGEELSAGNSKNQNVHFLLINNPEFFCGSGDSAEKWFRTTPEFQVEEVLTKLRKDALAFAAHPEITPPFLQRLLIRRGKWLNSDYQSSRLNGMQIWNGKKDRFFEAGIKKWVDLLLQGKRISIIAGNDAHGNFGRFRQIGIPFTSMRENDSEIFSLARTGVYLPNGFGVDKISKALRSGRMIVTDGPFAQVTLSGNAKNRHIGDCFPLASGLVQFVVLSSESFGAIKSVALLVGDVTRKKETRRYFFRPSSDSYQFETEKFVADLPVRGYIRLDVTSTQNGKTFRCLTNPIYIDQTI
ncbi:MAG: hypothetical protein GWP06_05600 [Actinobacteria bacterium]|nr:hypothetical protein [Actinomycetota bacterium]